MNAAPPRRETFVVEFSRPFGRGRGRVTVDCAGRRIRFEQCHAPATNSFWSSPFQGTDECFECPFDEVLEAYTVRDRGRSQLLIVTSRGRASVPSSCGFRRTADFDRLQRVLQEVARQTPSRRWEHPFLAWVLIGVAIAIAIIISVVIAE